jgi:hypothetical protein
MTTQALLQRRFGTIWLPTFGIFLRIKTTFICRTVMTIGQGCEKLLTTRHSFVDQLFHNVERFCPGEENKSNQLLLEM